MESSSKEKKEEEENIEDEDITQIQYKFILLGDGAVGKTSIALRHTGDSFSNIYKQTIGVDFFLKRIILPGKIHVALQIWDIGGQTIGGKMIKNYIFGAHAVLLAYDITNYESFQNLEDWYRLVRQTFKDHPMPYLALIGNKTDLIHMRQVALEKHKQFMEENEMHGYFVSAKTGDEVNSAFYHIASALAGVAVTKPEAQIITPIVKAHIIDYQKDDAEVKAPDMRRQDKNCTLQ